MDRLLRIRYGFILKFCFIAFVVDKAEMRKLRSLDKKDLDTNPLTNSVDFIWGTTTVAVGDTAVLHCSFDAIFQQLRNGNIDWFKEITSAKAGESETTAVPVATGKKVVVKDGRYRVYRPHNSALSVLIIRRSKKKDAGIYRCNLSGSSTRHKYMVLNVTESKIEAQTSPATLRAKIGNDVTLWCNATGYPKPVVYWTREDRNRQLPDGNYQYWGNGLQVKSSSEADTGIYACYLDNFVQPIVSYKFSLMVEDNPWNLDGYKMRFDSKQWYPQDSVEPKPVKTKSFLLMCEARGASKPQPLIRWYRDGKAIRNNKHFYIIEDSPESRSSYASSTLVIMNFLPRFFGNYTCVASNVFRMKKLTFYVREYLEPKDVEDVSSPDVDARLSIPNVIRAPDKYLPNSIALGVTRMGLQQQQQQQQQQQHRDSTNLKQTSNAKSRLDETSSSSSSSSSGKGGSDATDGSADFAKSWIEKGRRRGSAKTVATATAEAATDDDDDEDMAAANGSGNSSDDAQ